MKRSTAYLNVLFILIMSIFTASCNNKIEELEKEESEKAQTVEKEKSKEDIKDEEQYEAQEFKDIIVGLEPISPAGEEEQLICLCWDDDDEISVVWIQEEHIFPMHPIRPVETMEDKARFKLPIPKEIKQESPLKLVLFKGKGLKDGMLKIDKRPWNNTHHTLDEIIEEDMRLYYIKELTSLGSLEEEVTLEQLGSLFILNIKNKSKKTTSWKYLTLETSKKIFFGQHGNRDFELDLAEEQYYETSESNKLRLAKDIILQPKDSTKIVKWFIPKNLINEEKHRLKITQGNKEKRNDRVFYIPTLRKGNYYTYNYVFYY